MASYDKIVLFEGARWNPVITYKNKNRVAQPITDFVFTMNFLDKRGGTILLTINPAIVNASAGTFQPSLTAAQIEAFATRPTWAELYVVVPGNSDPLKWMDLPVEYREGGG